MPVARRGVEPAGYVLVTRGETVPTTLFPALGSQLPDTSATGLWSAMRLVNHLNDAGGDNRMLVPIDGLPYTADLSPASGVAPEISWELSDGPDGKVAVRSGDREVMISPGDYATVALAERTVSVDRLADAVLAAYEASGVSEPPPRDSIIEDLASLAPDGGDATFYARLIVLNHGDVIISSTDLVSAWDDAQRLAREGPYEAALAALETVLDAVPGHANAARLFHHVLDLVEAGAVPSRAVGTIAFPAGQLDEDMQALWRATHSGAAIFSAEQGSTGFAFPIADGGFAAHLPAGAYHLTVDVPGFATAELDITLEGETTINVPIQRAN